MLPKYSEDAWPSAEWNPDSTAFKGQSSSQGSSLWVTPKRKGGAGGEELRGPEIPVFVSPLHYQCRAVHLGEKHSPTLSLRMSIQEVQEVTLTRQRGPRSRSGQLGLEKVAGTGVSVCSPVAVGGLRKGGRGEGAFPTGSSEARSGLRRRWCRAEDLVP